MFDLIGYNHRKINIYKNEPTNSFHRKKVIYNYNPEKCKEEQPTFSFENDKNVNYYKKYIENQSKAIDQYSQNYINYIHGKNKNLVFNNSNHYYCPTETFENISVSKSQPSLYNIGNYIMKGRTNEISNPVKYYKHESNYYDNFHDAEISYFDYNYNNMIKRRNNSLNVNPYNRGSSDSNLGKSFLRRNPILTPLHDYSYNKYFDGNYDKMIKKNNNNNNNNIKIINNNMNSVTNNINHNISNNNNTFIKAGTNSIFG